jgi:hypothetical protein
MRRLADCADIVREDEDTIFFGGQGKLAFVGRIDETIH